MTLANIMCVDGLFGSPSEREKPGQHRQKGVGKQIENSLNPSNRNNGSQAHEINKWVLRR